MSLSYAIGFIKAAVKTHETLLHNCFLWPLMTFDTTPLGRILNRFSNDINILDNVLPMTLQSGVTMVFTVMLIYFLLIFICESVVSTVFVVDTGTRGFALFSLRKRFRLTRFLFLLFFFFFVPAF
jgi:ABC-type multidrug transport system fused ATPase/permease subunit